ncbi:MAG: hypothetical protein ABUT20_03155 [Bacteroidota bacterium]
MKQNLFAAAIIILLSSFIIPLKKNIVKSIHSYFGYNFAAVSTDGTPDINLQKSSAIYQTSKSKTTPAFLNIDGAKSTVRLKTGAFEFLAHHVADGTATLTDGIALYKLNADKKNRSLTLEPTAITISNTKMVLTLIQTDAQTIKIVSPNDPTIPNGILSPGEYAFVEKNTAAVNSTLTVWCFGIDN